jgi:hypothetical protein
MLFIFQSTENDDDEEFSPQDIAKLKLDEPIDGLLIEPSSKVIKGGRLAKLVESMTSHHGLGMLIFPSP